MRKATTKTDAITAHGFKLDSLVLAVLEVVPLQKRIGPPIINEQTGRPYAEWRFTRDWSEVAKAAGVPEHVRNMDARAGAITEADDAGAELDFIRSTAAHAQASTALRYLRAASENRPL